MLSHMDRVSWIWMIIWGLSCCKQSKCLTYVSANLTKVISVTSGLAICIPKISKSDDITQELQTCTVYCCLLQYKQQLMLPLILPCWCNTCICSGSLLTKGDSKGWTESSVSKGVTVGWFTAGTTHRLTDKPEPVCPWSIDLGKGIKILFMTLDWMIKGTLL